MFVSLAEHLREAEHPPDVCIVGSGPAGTATALACARRGLSVLLLESGGDRDSPQVAELSEAEIVNPLTHAPMTIASRRGVGGTSRWWGGRCVEFDSIDFQQRDWVANSGWPLSHHEVSGWYQDALHYLGWKPQVFEPPTVDNGKWRAAGLTALERWAPEVDVAAIHGADLRNSKSIRVSLNATVVDLVFSDDADRIAGLVVIQDSTRHIVRAKHFVLACGGVETTRLMLVAQLQRPEAFGGRSGALGKFYAGHISGKISDLVLTSPGDVARFDFFVHQGAYARWRLTLNPDIQQRCRLLNSAFWLDNPPFHDPGHRSGTLSLVWLMLAIPAIGRLLASEGVRRAHVGATTGRWIAHARNVLTQPMSVLAQGAAIFQKRFASRPRQPGFLLKNGSGRYALHYHCEQGPNAESRITLADSSDHLGMRRARIDFRFSDQDIDSVLRSHEQLDATLQAADLGRLEYRAPPDKLRGLVSAQATDGFHQTGTTRMGACRKSSTVDEACAVHDAKNLYIVSSSVFPTSSQANPTLLTVALGLRLAEHLADSAL